METNHLMIYILDSNKINVHFLDLVLILPTPLQTHSLIVIRRGKVRPQPTLSVSLFDVLLGEHMRGVGQGVVNERLIPNPSCYCFNTQHDNRIIPELSVMRS